MSRILLLLDHAANRRLLSETLSTRYEVLPYAGDEGLAEIFDLCVVDGTALDRLSEAVAARRQSDSAFLPVLLVTSRTDVGFLTRELWRSLDEIIHSPVDRLELQARVEVLLRVRRQSLELLRATQNAEALVHALTHELRAPMRAVSGYADEILRHHADSMEAAAREHFNRIRWNSEQTRQLLESLLAFYQMDRREFEPRDVRLDLVLQSCIESLQEEIKLQGASVKVEGQSPSVRGDPTILKIIFRNLIANALKYVAPGVRPEVIIRVGVPDGYCRVSVSDNGVGIDTADQGRVFEPFVRLVSDDEVPGLGLGLAGVRKAVQLLDGRLGVDSVLGQGSTFWVELVTGSEP